jgi:nucleoid DNA-binding protein
MKNDALARTVAEKTQVSNAAAKDQVDEVVSKILKTLKQGRPVTLPGVGKLIPADRPKSR